MTKLETIAATHKAALNTVNSLAVQFGETVNSLINAGISPSIVIEDLEYLIIVENSDYWAPQRICLQINSEKMHSLYFCQLYDGKQFKRFGNDGKGSWGKGHPAQYLIDCALHIKTYINYWNS